MPLSFTVQVHPIAKPGGKMVAFADVIVEDFIRIKGFKVIDGANGLFVTAPNHQDSKDPTKYHDDVWFHEEKGEKEKRGPRQTEIYDAIIAAYQEGSTGTNHAPRQTAAKQQEDLNRQVATPKKPMW